MSLKHERDIKKTYKKPDKISILCDILLDKLEDELNNDYFRI